jgi:hypothetical protein
MGRLRSSQCPWRINQRRKRPGRSARFTPVPSTQVAPGLLPTGVENVDSIAVRYVERRVRGHPSEKHRAPSSGPQHGDSPPTGLYSTVAHRYESAKHAVASDCVGWGSSSRMANNRRPSRPGAAWVGKVRSRPMKATWEIVPLAGGRGGSGGMHALVVGAHALVE